MPRTMVLVQIAEECAHEVSALLRPMESEDELFRSANTLNAIVERVRVLASALGQMDQPWTCTIPALDWPAWQRVHEGLGRAGPPDRDMLWFVISSLVPATVVLLREARHQHPGLFMLT